MKRLTALFVILAFISPLIPFTAYSLSPSDSNSAYYTKVVQHSLTENVPKIKPFGYGSQQSFTDRFIVDWSVVRSSNAASGKPIS